VQLRGYHAVNFALKHPGLITDCISMSGGENFRMARIMGVCGGVRGVPHYLDVWKNGTGHDWPWWHQMARKFM
jgi:esterase/lipase superfamily enzyme